MTWSPLACGIITGKYENGIPESSRASMKVGADPRLFGLSWDPHFLPQMQLIPVQSGRLFTHDCCLKCRWSSDEQNRHGNHC